MTTPREQAFLLPPNHAYYGMASLFDTSRNPISTNPHNGDKPVPFFLLKAGADLAARRAVFQELPPHLQQQVSTIDSLQQEQFAATQNAAYQPRAQMPPVASHSASQHPAVHSSAQRTLASSPPKNKFLEPTTTHSFEAYGVRVNLQRTYTMVNEEVGCPDTLIEQDIWKQIEDLYTKYIGHKDLKLPGGKIDPLRTFFFLKDGKEYFEIQYRHQGDLSRRRIAVTPEDGNKLHTLRTTYPPILKRAPLDRTYRRVELSSKELQSKLHQVVSPRVAFENFNQYNLLEKVMKRGHEMRGSHRVELAHPLTADELQTANPTAFGELCTRALVFGTSWITCEAATDRVDTLSRSQFLFSKSPHQARIYYNVAPRPESHSSALATREGQHFAEHYPLHFSVNARLGHLHGSDAHLVEDHESAIIHTKRDLLGHQFAILVQEKIQLPDLATDANERLVKAIFDQTAKYHEIREGFKDSKQKVISVRDPLTPQGIEYAEGELEEDMKLSIFIRIAALNLLNSNPDLKGPKLNLEFEFNYSANGEAPASLEIVAQIRERINWAIEESERRGLSETIESLVAKFIDDDLLLSHPLPVEEEEQVPEAIIHLMPLLAEESVAPDPFGMSANLGDADL